MRFTEYGADDAELVEAGRRILNAARSVDSPWLPQLTSHRRQMDVRYGWDRSPVRHLLAWVDGQPVALADVGLGEWDNRDLSWCDLHVDPAHRRRGHGSRLLAHLMELSRDLGRTKIGGGGWELPATEPFARTHGFDLASHEVHRVVVLDEASRRLADEVRAEAARHAGDYELLRLEGRTPTDLLAAVADLTAAINDAPLDDLDIEDEVFPVGRIMDYETSSIDSGHRLYRVIARHRGTGELAGHTIVLVDAERPEIGHQHDTSVVRAHRGHRLGLLLKADLMCWLAEVEPQVASIDTWNAESNAHMIGVNERLGYRAMGRELAFQRRL